MLGVSSSEEPAVSPFPTALCGIFPGLLVQYILVTYPRRNSLRLRDPKRIDRAEYWLGLATWQGKTGLNYFLLAVDVAHNVQICK